MKYQMKWLVNVIPPSLVNELSTLKVVSVPSGSICLLCKGGRMLCGKRRCPVIARAQSLVRGALKITSPVIEGSTPPGVFVGRIGYPKVYVGPMVPPIKGDTSILDTPEMWLGKGIQEIVDYRFALVRGKSRADVRIAEFGSRLVETLQELALGGAPADAEVVLERMPSKTLTLGSEIQPFGPSAPMRSLRVGEVKTDHELERAFYDRDLKASEAVVELYSRGVLVSRIQRAFSLGMFGVKERRKLVPTRWSITAVDSIISQELVSELKRYDTIDEYRVYTFRHLDNRFVAVLMPERWSFEWIEAWFPGTTWNPDRFASRPAMMGDHEPYQGRTTYPDIGGCYYSCKLAVGEQLVKERRQASVLVLREIHPGYILPVGVWNVRESVRAMMRQKPARFDNLQAALEHAMRQLTIPLERWVESSWMLQRALHQKRITEFLP
jgi:hypothetical protein